MRMYEYHQIGIWRMVMSDGRWTGAWLSHFVILDSGLGCIEACISITRSNRLFCILPKQQSERRGGKDRRGDQVGIGTCHFLIDDKHSLSKSPSEIVPTPKSTSNMLSTTNEHSMISTLQQVVPSQASLVCRSPVPAMANGVLLSGGFLW